VQQGPQRTDALLRDVDQHFGYKIDQLIVGVLAQHLLPGLRLVVGELILILIVRVHAFETGFGGGPEHGHDRHELLRRIVANK
jgi:hypothetical protein